MKTQGGPWGGAPKGGKMANLKLFFSQYKSSCVIMFCVLIIFIYIKNEVCSWQILGRLPWAPRGVKVWGRGPSWKKKHIFIRSYPEPVSRFQSNLVEIIPRGWDPKCFILGMWAWDGGCRGRLPRIEMGQSLKILFYRWESGYVIVFCENM